MPRSKQTTIQEIVRKVWGAKFSLGEQRILVQLSEFMACPCQDPKEASSSSIDGRDLPNQASKGNRRRFG